MPVESAEPVQPSTALEDTISARYGVREPGTFDRLMFALMIPAFALGPLAIFTTWLGRSANGLGDADLLALVVGVFMFVQLGSQVLNAWLILRRRASYMTRALPRALGVVNAITYGVLVSWMVFLVLAPDNLASFIFAAALAILGLMALFVITNVRIGDKALRLEPPIATFPSTARLGTIIYLTLASAGLIAATVIAVIQSHEPTSTPAIVGLPALIMLMLGLPWSHTLYGILFVVTIFTLSTTELSWIALPFLALPVLANITISLIVLLSPSRRDSLISWFFRLKEPVLSPRVGDGNEALDSE